MTTVCRHGRTRISSTPSTSASPAASTAMNVTVPDAVLFNLCTVPAASLNDSSGAPTDVFRLSFARQLTSVHGAGASAGRSNVHTTSSSAAFDTGWSRTSDICGDSHSRSFRRQCFQTCRYRAIIAHASATARCIHCFARCPCAPLPSPSCRCAVHVFIIICFVQPHSVSSVVSRPAPCRRSCRLALPLATMHALAFLRPSDNLSTAAFTNCFAEIHEES